MQIKEKLMLEFERDPNFKMDDIHDLTRPQIRERYMTRVKNLMHYVINDSLEITKTRFNVLSVIDPGFMTRMGVHVILLTFLHIVRSFLGCHNWIWYC
jgi:acyl-CoA oxidase